MHRIAGVALVIAALAWAQDGERLLRVDHYVRVHSTLPAVAGQITQIYVRDVVRPGMTLRDIGSPDPVVLFVHGAGTPAEVSFANQNIASRRMCPARRLCSGINGTLPAGLPQPGQKRCPG